MENPFTGQNQQNMMAQTNYNNAYMGGWGNQDMATGTIILPSIATI